MTPQEWYDAAARAINQDQFDRATACAVTGLLSLAIGAFEGLRDACAPNEQ